MPLIFPSELGSDAQMANYMGFYPLKIDGGVGSAKSDRSYVPASEPAIYLPIPIEGVADTYMNNWGAQEVEIASMAAAQKVRGLDLGGQDSAGIIAGLTSKFNTGLANKIDQIMGVNEFASGSGRGTEGMQSGAAAFASGMRDEAISGAKQAGVGVTLQAVGRPIAQSAGIAGFKQTAVLYGGPQFRAFTFSFSLKPLSLAEQQTIEDIIRSFKMAASPQLNEGGMYRIYSLPLVYEIKFYHFSGENHALPKISKCALQNIGVKYGGDRFQTFVQGHAPVQTDISLQFIELELVTKNTLQADNAAAAAASAAVMGDSFAAMPSAAVTAARQAKAAAAFKTATAAKIDASNAAAASGMDIPPTMGTHAAAAGFRSGDVMGDMVPKGEARRAAGRGLGSWF